LDPDLADSALSETSVMVESSTFEMRLMRSQKVCSGWDPKKKKAQKTSDDTMKINDKEWGGGDFVLNGCESDFLDSCQFDGEASEWCVLNRSDGHRGSAPSGLAYMMCIAKVRQ